MARSTRKVEDVREDVGDLVIGRDLYKDDDTRHNLFAQPPHVCRKMFVTSADNGVGDHVDTCGVVFMEGDSGHG